MPVVRFLLVEDIGLDVIQAPKSAPRMMRYELTDFEWTAIVGPRVPDAVQRFLAVRRSSRECNVIPG